jgi:hypothetical protein
LAAINFQARKVQEGCIKEERAAKENTDDAKIDADICHRLPGRYVRAALNVKLRLAYLWAQEGMYWPSAKEYADANFEALKKESNPPFACLDDYESFNVRDTYAFVQISFRARRNRSDMNELDLAAVRDARWLLQEVRSQLENLQSREGAAGQCIYHEQTKLWLRRVKGHLKLADAILQ